MDLFGKLPQEQAFQTLVHDTNSATQQIKWHVDQMYAVVKRVREAYLEKGIEINTPSDFFIHGEYLKSENKKIQDAVDTYHVQFKNDFNL